MTYGEYSAWLWARAADETSPEWRIVALYYAALHATNSVLYVGRSAPQSHGAHMSEIEKSTLTLHATTYQELERLSRDARYRPSVHPISTEKVAHAERLAKVILSVCSVIA